MKKFLVVLVLLTMATRLWAGDLEWSGLYRFEGLQLQTPNLDSSTGKRKEYALHALILRPKIVAADGLYINAQLNIFNSDEYNQLGQYFGNGPGDGTSSSVNDSNAAAENGQSEQIRVSHFYLTHVQEYGQLILGRAPMHFGLGITHNAGRESFDHFADTRDVVGYKMVMGNFFFMPSYAKISEGDLAGYDDIQEWNYQLQYENPDSDASVGVIYQNRIASRAGNDMPTEAITETPTSNIQGQFEAKNFNVFFKKETENYRVGLEVAQQGGDTGVYEGTSEASLSGFGAALEFEYHPKESKNAFGFKAGMATGDDPDTEDDFEGYIFDRNYDVAMLLFNHGLGQADLLHTKLIGRNENYTNGTVNGQPDVEAISNVTYLSPYFRRKFSDKWSMTGVLTMGWLDVDTVTNPSGGADYTGVDADLGYELDVAFTYTVSEKIQWVNQVGYLMPGDAWKMGTAGFDNNNIFGFMTKAAVSF